MRLETCAGSETSRQGSKRSSTCRDALSLAPVLYRPVLVGSSAQLPRTCPDYGAPKPDY